MKVNSLCRIRDVQKALQVYEQQFVKATGLTLKEGMLLCCLSENDCNATHLAEKIELSCSNCSKVINSAEKKGLIQRHFGLSDKRQIRFSLTNSGKTKVELMKQNLPEIPQILKI